MDSENTTKALKKSDYEEALRTAKTLLDDLKTKEKWLAADEKKLEKLKQIVTILTKLKPLKKKTASKSIVFDRKKDEEIVRRFIERMKNERL